MAVISKEELLKFAHMSQLRLEDDEIAGLLKHIDDVLTYAQRVQDLAKRGTVQETSAKNINVLREDIIIPTDPQPILGQAPESDRNYFVVPAILEHT